LIKNQHGQVRQITLPDGSRVWLNAASTIEYYPAFSVNRDIKLEGEAFFEVKPDASHPFTVHTQKLNTTVLGTSFNIKSFSDDNFIDVSVVHGKVSVEETSRKLALLTRNKSLRFDKQHNKAEVYTADSTEFSSWKDGRLQFSGESLIEIVTNIRKVVRIFIRF
jgi:ferric-dicitrate binding protein FerR (iron transport regulator)